MSGTIQNTRVQNCAVSEILVPVLICYNCCTLLRLCLVCLSNTYAQAIVNSLHWQVTSGCCNFCNARTARMQCVAYTHFFQGRQSSWRRCKPAAERDRQSTGIRDLWRKFTRCRLRSENSDASTFAEEEEEEEFYKLRPANKTDHLCQSWQYCHMFMKSDSL